MNLTPPKPKEPRSPLLRTWVVPELYTAGLLLLAWTFCVIFIPRFGDAHYLMDRSSLYLEVGILALGMTFVIVAGHIDLSCASILALVPAVLLTIHHKLGIPMGPLLLSAPLLGGALGAANGALVAILKLPSLVVTLGTMAVYRGMAQVLLGEHSLPLPAPFVGLEQYTLIGTPVPVVVFAFILLTVALGLLLHRTLPGRWVMAMGTNPRTAHYSAVPIAGTTQGVFTLNGALAGLAGLTLVSRLGVARYDHALGMELDVITVVVLGGASIFGGRGTVLGSILALLLLAVIQTGMGVANVKTEFQQTANGALLILALALSNLTRKIRP